MIISLAMMLGRDSNIVVLLLCCCRLVSAQTTWLHPIEKNSFYNALQDILRADRDVQARGLGPIADRCCNKEGNWEVKVKLPGADSATLNPSPEHTGVQHGTKVRKTR